MKKPETQYSKNLKVILAYRSIMRGLICFCFAHFQDKSVPPTIRKRYQETKMKHLRGKIFLKTCQLLASTGMTIGKNNFNASIEKSYSFLSQWFSLKNLYKNFFLKFRKSESFFLRYSEDYIPTYFPLILAYQKRQGQMSF